MADNETGIKYDSEKEAVYSNFFALMNKNTESYRRRVLRAEGFLMAATIPSTDKLEVEDIEPSFKEARKRKQWKNLHPHARSLEQTYEIHELTNDMGGMYNNKEIAAPEETDLEISENKTSWKYPAPVSEDVSGLVLKVQLKDGTYLSGIDDIPQKPQNGILSVKGTVLSGVDISLKTKSGANVVIFEDGKLVEF